MSKNQVTNDEIMTTLVQFAASVDSRFDVVDKWFNRLETDATEIKTDVNRIYGILDAHMSRIKQMIQEKKVQAHQQEFLERWIFQLANQAGVKLKYE